MCFTLRAAKICRWEGLWTVFSLAPLGHRRTSASKEGRASYRRKRERLSPWACGREDRSSSGVGWGL